MSIRYARQEALWGEEGQRKLAQAHVAVIGAGGLGSPALLYPVSYTHLRAHET